MLRPTPGDPWGVEQQHWNIEAESDNVEDEIHFLTEWSAFSVERNVFFNRISKICKISPPFQISRNLYLFSNENANVLRVFAQFVYDC